MTRLGLIPHNTSGRISLQPALALASPFRYKRGLISDFARAICAGRPSPDADRNHLPKNLQGLSHGRSEKKNIALAAWHASLG
jgi:hypothetical protein